jgi:hypothetical protein
MPICDRYELNGCIVDLLLNGPQRVVVKVRGGLYATCPDLAARDYGIYPEVVFIRADGWTLGTPRRFEPQASKLWTWLARVDLSASDFELLAKIEG